LGCAHVSSRPELEKLGPIVLSLEYSGDAMSVQESPYLFVLYENRRAVFVRAERASDGRWSRWYRTALLSTAEIEGLRQALEPSELFALAPEYDLLPGVSDLGWTTLRVGPPWLTSVDAVSVRGFLEPDEITQFHQTPPPPPFARAIHALRSVRFSDDTPYEVRELRLASISPIWTWDAPSDEQCVLPADWLTARVSDTAGWGRRWLVEGSRVADVEDVLTRCRRSVVFQGEHVHVSERVPMPHELAVDVRLKSPAPDAGSLRRGAP
jgi:hypothetical protein